MFTLGALLLQLSALILVAVPLTDGFLVIGRPSVISKTYETSSTRCHPDNSRTSTIITNPLLFLTSADQSESFMNSMHSIFSFHTEKTIPRRQFFQQSISTPLALGTIVATSPQVASAKDKDIPITREMVSDAFQTIRTELSSPTGLISTLKKLIDANSYPEIMQYTKESDAYFRKAKLGKARKLLTDSTLKNDAILLSNAVTFDLIGINRASRPGKENREEQMKYLDELRKDIERFLELESTIVVAGE